MKKFTSALFILLVSFCFILTGCSGGNLSMPTNYTQVASNGGFVVKAGDYYYMANAYQSYSNLTEKADNNGDKVKQYDIKRIQQDGSSLKKDDDGNLKLEHVANKIAGYETSNMYVVGEYLYFTTPNVHKNDSKEQEEFGKYQFELSTLFRIKLDGSGLKELYTAESSSAKFYLAGSTNQCILIYDDEKILKIDASSNSTKVKTLAEKVTGAVFANELNANLAFYTTARENSELTGNILNKLDVETGTSTELSGYVGALETVSLVSLSNNKLFYSITQGSELRKGVYVQDFNTNPTTAPNSMIRTNDCTTTSSKIYAICDQDFDVDVFVFEYNKNIYIQNMSAQGDSAGIKISAEEATIAFVDGTYVYYTTDNGIFRISINKTSSGYKTEQISDVKSFNKDKLDFDGRYVYFFAEADGASSGTKYLYRADIANAVNKGEDTSNLLTECIAKLLDSDLKDDE